MKSEHRGYSYALVQKARTLPSESHAARLFDFCFERGIAVTTIASALHTTRATIYAWFTGLSRPHKKRLADIDEFIRQRSNV